MSAHLLHLDFFRFLDALTPERDPWEVYEEYYLSPNRAALEAWWDQCLGLPRAAWAERVRAVRPEHYGLLREVVREADLASLAEEVLPRCAAWAPLSPPPEVYYLVGFFSPDAFTFEVEGRRAIGIGLERFGRLDLLPVMLAHEYAHCYRRSLRRPRTLRDRMVDEGFAVALSGRVFPDRPEADHLLMRQSRLRALREYESRLWRAIRPHLDSDDEKLIGRILYGRSRDRMWASRAGVYLGWRAVQDFQARRGAGFEAPAREVLPDPARED